MNDREAAAADRLVVSELELADRRGNIWQAETEKLRVEIKELRAASQEVARFAKRRDAHAIALEERVAKYRSRSIDRGEYASRCRICNGIWSHTREAGEWHEADCPNKLPVE